MSNQLISELKLHGKTAAYVSPVLISGVGGMAVFWFAQGVEPTLALLGGMAVAACPVAAHWGWIPSPRWWLKWGEEIRAARAAQAAQAAQAPKKYLIVEINE